MVVSALRPFLLVLAGAAVGSLVTFGLVHQQEPVQGNLTQSEHAPQTLRAPSPGSQEENSGAQPLVSDETQEPSEGTASLQQQAAVEAPKQHVPVRPIPKPKMAFQANGLPVGVTPGAGISDVYKRLPGVQPPLVNRDGRDLGPEAIQMLETHSQEKLPFPGGLPSASATAMPIPQTIEEANRQVQQAYASPTP
jgi:hypothetical protein